MFRHILLSTAAVVALSTASFAADLPTHKAPAPYVPAPIFTWTGFYVGAQVGAGWTKDKVSDFAANNGALLGTGNLDKSGIVGGLHAGYNMQTGSIVYGLEADLELSGLSKTSGALFAGNALVGGVYSFSQKIDWQGSVRGRLGYASGPALFYVTGGLAFANVKYGYSNPINFANTAFAVGAGSYSFSSVRTGWTLGAGLEYAFNNNWSARIEYRYTDFGSFTNSTGALPVTMWSNENIKHKLTEQAVRVGITYKFGGPAGPVVARY